MLGAGRHGVKWSTYLMEPQLVVSERSFATLKVGNKTYLAMWRSKHNIARATREDSERPPRGGGSKH